MADVPASLNSWSSTASSNLPTDATTIGSGLSDNLQALQAVVRGDLAHKGSDIASSAAPDVGAVQGLYHDLTGSNTVTGLGSTATAGIWKIFQTDGAAVFQHNTALAMPGAADYTSAAGEILAFMCEASNQWRCMFGNPFATPAGALMDYAGSTAPSGWLECNGTAVSRTTYARLFTAISTTWGAGDGSTTFNLPNFRGRVRVGRGTGTLAENCTAGAVSTGSDNWTVASNTDKWVTGMKVQVSSDGSLPTGLSASTDYYIIRDSATTIQFATSLANSQNGTEIDITGAGTGTHTVTHTLTARTIGEYGGEEIHAISSTENLAHTHGSVITGGVTNNNNTAAAADSYIASLTTGTSGSTGGNVAMNNMQPFGIVMTIIKV